MKELFSMPYTCGECVGYRQILARAEEAERKLASLTDFSMKIVNANKMLMERVEESIGNDTSFDTWLQIGYSKNWVGPPVCSTHDGVPMSLDEDNEFNEGSDPCIHIMRLYESQGHKIEIEDFHSPSVWRAHNQGLDISE